MNQHDVTLVTNGTGKTGRRVVERLQLRGLPFRCGSRSAQPAFDWEDRRTWGPCLAGITQANVTYFRTCAFPAPWIPFNPSLAKR
jgi:hypothetical protein